MSKPTYSEAYRRWRRQVAVATGLTVAIVLAATALMLRLDDPPAWFGVTVAVAGMAPVTWTLISGYAFAWRWGGVEQVVFVQSTSTAFLVVMIANGIWGMLEAFAHIDPLSAWATYLLGSLTWSGMSLWLTRRMS